MRSVLVAQRGLVNTVDDNTIFTKEPSKQDKSKQVRYTKKQDFTEQIAHEFLQRETKLDLSTFNYPDLLAPIFG